MSQQESHQTSTSVFKFINLEADKIVFKPFEDNPRVKSQRIGYIYYSTPEGEEVTLKAQTPEFEAETFGFPKEGPYYPDPKSRAFYKLPFCHERKKSNDVNYAEIEKFYNVCRAIDARCGSVEFRKQMFTEKLADQYAYQPLIRTPEIDPEAEPRLDKNGQPYYNPPYTKVKVDLEYSPDPESATNKPIVKLFERKDGKRIKVELSTFDQLVEFIKIRSKLRFIISFSKLYAMKTKSGAEKKKYGIIIKVTHIEVQRPTSYRQVQQDDAFIDSDNDVQDDDQPKVSRQKLEMEEVKDTADNLDKKQEQEHEQEQEQEHEEAEEVVEEEVVEDKPKSSKQTTKPKGKAGKH